MKAPIVDIHEDDGTFITKTLLDMDSNELSQFINTAFIQSEDTDNDLPRAQSIASKLLRLKQ